MILVFGQHGQVARELARLAPTALFAGRARCDLARTDLAHLRDWLCAQAPRAVINAAAYTDVDQAEAEEDLATRINGHAPRAMADACRDLAIPLVHLSTDYVFDGAGSTPYSPDHPTAPLNAYGRSKLIGEEAVRHHAPCHAILRVSWVFSAHGRNFLRSMLRLGAERAELRVVADQIGGPTPARAVASACLHLATRLQADASASGTWHFAGTPAVSWAGFARAIMAAAHLPCAIQDIPSTDYPTPAHRPLNSRLDCSGLARIGLAQPDWRAALPDIIEEAQRQP